MKRTSLAILATLLMMASTTFAGTTATSTNQVSPTLQISATIVSAVQLTLTQGASGTACAITPNAGGNPDYTMSFGTVDALAISAGACGQKYTPAQTGTDAVYYTDYQLNPLWASQANTANPQITAYATAFGSANIKIVRDSANSAAAPAANGFSFMSTNAAAQDTIATGVASGTPLTRYIGVDIASTNGAGMAGGPKTATVTFTLTVN